MPRHTIIGDRVEKLVHLFTRIFSYPKFIQIFLSEIAASAVADSQ
jgi:hypothetical protein